MTTPSSGESISSERLLRTLQHLLACDAFNLATALTQVATVLTDVLSADLVDVLLYDPAIDSLVAVGMSQTPLAFRQRQLGLDRLPLSHQGRTVAVFRTGTPYMTGQADTDSQVLPGFTDGLGVRSMLLTPLVVQNERRGVLSVSTTTHDAFTPTDLTLLTTIAQWIGMVVYRAELVDILRHEVAAQTHSQTAKDLMTMLAHDLGNYLSPIQGRIQMVRLRAEREQRTRDLRDLEAALTGIDRLQRLVQDLMDSERISQGLFHIVPTLVDLMPLVNATASALQTSPHPITVTGPAELCLQADASRLRQALENVLTNALKHTPSTVPVQITCACEERSDGWWAVIHVADQGPGIPPPLLTTMTQRFVAHGPQAGLGLGLHLVHGIVTAHGGTVTIESVAGRGTTVVVAVPCADPTSAICAG